MTDVSKELLPTEADLHLARLGDYPGAAGTKRIAAAYDALTRAQPAPADVVERAMLEVLRWRDSQGMDSVTYRFVSECAERFRAALSAIPVSGEVGASVEENDPGEEDCEWTPSANEPW